MKAKFLKLSILTAFAVFGVYLHPSVMVLADQQQVSVQQGQHESYMFEFKHKKSGQSIVQLFKTKEEHGQRLTEIKESNQHVMLGTTWVRQDGQDYKMTQIEVG